MKAVDEVTLRGRLQSMLELQDGINSKIRPDWRDANNAWFRAIWTECAELLDHVGWKWWKHQSPNIPQVQLELVDCRRRSKSDPPRRSNIDPGMDADRVMVGCGQV